VSFRELTAYFLISTKKVGRQRKKLSFLKNSSSRKQVSTLNRREQFPGAQPGKQTRELHQQTINSDLCLVPCSKTHSLGNIQARKKLTILTGRNFAVSHRMSFDRLKSWLFVYYVFNLL